MGGDGGPGTCDPHGELQLGVANGCSQLEVSPQNAPKAPSPAAGGRGAAPAPSRYGCGKG